VTFGSEISDKLEF